MKTDIKKIIIEGWKHIKQRDIKGLIYFIRHDKLVIEFFSYLFIGIIYTMISFVSNHFIVDEWHWMRASIWNLVLIPPMFVLRFFLVKMIFQKDRKV